MLYDYECKGCGKTTEHEFSMSDVPRTVKCECGGTARRVYNSFALGVNGALDRKSTFGEEMKKRNDKAAHRQKGRKAPVRTVAHDYGNGDVREVK